MGVFFFFMYSSRRSPRFGQGFLLLAHLRGSQSHCAILEVAGCVTRIRRRDLLEHLGVELTDGLIVEIAERRLQSLGSAPRPWACRLPPGSWHDHRASPEVHRDAPGSSWYNRAMYILRALDNPLGFLGSEPLFARNKPNNKKISNFPCDESIRWVTHNSSNIATLKNPVFKSGGLFSSRQRIVFAKSLKTGKHRFILLSLNNRNHKILIPNQNPGNHT